MIYKSPTMMFFCLIQIVYCSQKVPVIPSTSSWDMCSADSPHHLIKSDIHESSCDESSKKTSRASLPELEEKSAIQAEAPAVVNVVMGPLPTEDFIKNTVGIDIIREEKTELTRKQCMPQFVRGVQPTMLTPVNTLFPYRPDPSVYTIPGVVKTAVEEPEADWLQKAKNALGNFFSASSAESIDGEELGNDNV